MDEERGSYLIGAAPASAESLLVTNLCSVHGNIKFSKHKANSQLPWIGNGYRSASLICDKIAREHPK